MQEWANKNLCQPAARLSWNISAAAALTAGKLVALSRGAELLTGSW